MPVAAGTTTVEQLLAPRLEMVWLLSSGMQIFLLYLLTQTTQQAAHLRRRLPKSTQLPSRSLETLAHFLKMDSQRFAGIPWQMALELLTHLETVSPPLQM